VTNDLVHSTLQMTYVVKGHTISELQLDNDRLTNKYQIIILTCQNWSINPNYETIVIIKSLIID